MAPKLPNPAMITLPCSSISSASRPALSRVPKRGCTSFSLSSISTGVTAIVSATTAISVPARDSADDVVAHREGQQHKGELATLGEGEGEEQILVEAHLEDAAEDQKHQRTWKRSEPPSDRGCAREPRR